MKTAIRCLGSQAGAERSTILAPVLLSADQVSQLTGVAAATLATWRSRGGGPRWFKLGGKIVRYKYDDVLSWIEDGRRESNEPTKPQRKLALPILRGRPNLDRRHRLGRHRTQ